jgi:hypothetical protein
MDSCESRLKPYVRTCVTIGNPCVLHFGSMVFLFYFGLTSLCYYNRKNPVFGTKIPLRAHLCYKYSTCCSSFASWCKYPYYSTQVLLTSSILDMQSTFVGKVTFASLAFVLPCPLLNRESEVRPHLAVSSSMLPE